MQIRARTLRPWAVLGLLTIAGPSSQIAAAAGAGRERRQAWGGDLHPILHPFQAGCKGRSLPAQAIWAGCTLAPYRAPKPL